jgi:hypothetical protein
MVALLVVASLPSSASAVVILDTGTPDESGNRSVFANPGLPGAQFLAQEFMLTLPTEIDTIEAYIGGPAGNSVTMDLASSIGTTATASDLIASSTLATPGTSPNSGAFVSATVSQTFQPGTYFLVFSGDTGGQFMPIDAPSTIGSRFLASDFAFPFTNVNTTLPIASNFGTTNARLGIRISGTVIPEPSTFAIWSVLATLGITVGWWRRRRAA